MNTLVDCDIYLPYLNVAIMIDGPSHFFNSPAMVPLPYKIVSRLQEAIDGLKIVRLTAVSGHFFKHSLIRKNFI